MFKSSSETGQETNSWMRPNTATSVQRRKWFLDKVTYNRADMEVEPWSWARSGQDKKRDDPTDILPPKPPSLYNAAMQHKVTVHNIINKRKTKHNPIFIKKLCMHSHKTIISKMLLMIISKYFLIALYKSFEDFFQVLFVISQVHAKI